MKGIITRFRPLLTGLCLTCLTAAAPAAPAAAQSVFYNVTFDATWSEATHPVDFPPAPHFSGLVGGTHDGSVSFWQTGELASLGMKRMAEWGSQADLLAEVQVAIDAGQAVSSISDDPLWTVPGSTDVMIELTSEFPLVTLVAMIAPSPDWFVGVRNLDLRPGGQWAEEIIVDLFAFDAGTDSGPAYTSPDLATVPPEPIAPITGYPFTPGEPLGTFTFTLAYTSEVPEAAALAATAYPNPFNPRTTIAWEMPAEGPMRVEIHDLRGRLVRRLRDELTSAGPGRVTWNGFDDAGRAVGAGVYLARVTTGTATLTRKLTLAK